MGFNFQVHVGMTERVSWELNPAETDVPSGI